jgi:8-hydroxy-5-deazaflavin:NADPH oxidoreductase
MTTVGFIGSGYIGSTIARLAIEAGHQVVLSNSRGPETLADTAAELGPRASAATSGEAAAAGDIVVVTVPIKAFPNLPRPSLCCTTSASCGSAGKFVTTSTRPSSASAAL